MISQTREAPHFSLFSKRLAGVFHGGGRDDDRGGFSFGRATSSLFSAGVGVKARAYF